MITQVIAMKCQKEHVLKLFNGQQIRFRLKKLWNTLIGEKSVLKGTLEDGSSDEGRKMNTVSSPFGGGSLLFERLNQGQCYTVI